MNLLRKILIWIFGIEAFSYFFSNAVMPVLTLSKSQATDPDQINGTGAAFMALYIGFSVVLAMAWWTAQKQGASFRFWALAASMLNLFVWIPTLYFVPHVHWVDVLPLTVLLHVPVGIAGMVAFWPVQTTSQISRRSGAPSLPAWDGTIPWLNKFAGASLLIGALGIFSWWQYWFSAKGIPLGTPTLPGTVLRIFLAILAAGPVAEISTSIVGLTCGMKLRSFALGPFVWSYRGGRYEAQFNLGRLLSLGGATGFTPANSGYSRSAEICVLTAGPIATFVAGLTALGIAFSSAPDSPLQVGGYLSLFGASCLLVTAVALMPYRTGDSYSPGALVLQLLRGGPFADLHEVSAQVASSLMGPTRPKDFNIDQIERAAGALGSGFRGFVLQLYAYSHFLDCGDTPGASKALLQAASIYRNAALNIPAQLHTDLIFGCAYVRRDAASARDWWERMQAKTPTRQNVDYWRAKGSLHWIEGDLVEADRAWTESHVMAQRLPRAGVYDFDRYCCDLLRKALDEAIEGHNPVQGRPPEQTV